jgi:hypothetical protein
MARLVKDPSATIDLHSNWGNFPNPWQSLVTGAISGVFQRLGYGGSRSVWQFDWFCQNF